MEKELFIRCGDGRTLAASLHGDGARAELVAVVAGATGVRRRLYRAYAEHLSSRGIATLTFDYRGVGGSRGGSLRRDPARLADWGRLDLTAALDWAGAELGARRLCVVAHSVGGQVLPLVARPERIDAVVYVAAQEGYFGHWPMPLRLVFLLLCAAAMPGLVRAAGFLPARLLRLGEDLPPGVGRDWARWARSRGYMQRAPLYDRIAAPALAYDFADDPLAPRRAVDALLASQPRLVVTRRHVTPGDLGVKHIGHFGFFRRETGGALWAESADWLLEVSAAGACSGEGSAVRGAS
ncbi:MAG TPA: alpha/beta fold hydrolase [Candidatus Binatia bacterium]